MVQWFKVNSDQHRLYATVCYSDGKAVICYVDIIQRRPIVVCVARNVLITITIIITYLIKQSVKEEKINNEVRRVS